MPSLNRLQANPVFNNLQVIPINVGRDNVERSKNFYKKLKINNLEIYFDKDAELANKFLLRGLPTTVFINKKGEELARVIGFVNFDDKKIIKWLQKYD
jgi:thioredoxin-related protein